MAATNQATGRDMTPTATDPVTGRAERRPHGGRTPVPGGNDRWQAPPTTNPPQGAPATITVRSALIYDPPDAPVALARQSPGPTRRYDITCAAGAADLIAASAGRPADLVFSRKFRGARLSGLLEEVTASKQHGTRCPTRVYRTAPTCSSDRTSSRAARSTTYPR